MSRNKGVLTALKVAACAAASALFMLLPHLFFAADDAARMGLPVSDAGAARGEGSLSAEGIDRPAALALYIDHNFVCTLPTGISLAEGGQDELCALKECGVLGEEVSLGAEGGSVVAVISVEPVSGVVAEVGVRGAHLPEYPAVLDAYAAYLGLGDVGDWVELELPTGRGRVCGRWSPSCLVYLAAALDGGGLVTSVSARSFTEAEMRPVLELAEQER